MYSISYAINTLETIVALLKLIKKIVESKVISKREYSKLEDFLVKICSTRGIDIDVETFALEFGDVIIYNKTYTLYTRMRSNGREEVHIFLTILVYFVDELLSKIKEELEKTNIFHKNNQEIKAHITELHNLGKDFYSKILRTLGTDYTRIVLIGRRDVIVQSDKYGEKQVCQHIETFVVLLEQYLNTLKQLLVLGVLG